MLMQQWRKINTQASQKSRAEYQVACPWGEMLAHHVNALLDEQFTEQIPLFLHRYLDPKAIRT